MYCKSGSSSQHKLTNPTATQLTTHYIQIYSPTLPLSSFSPTFLPNPLLQLFYFPSKSQSFPFPFMISGSVFQKQFLKVLLSSFSKIFKNSIQIIPVKRKLCLDLPVEFYFEKIMETCLTTNITYHMFLLVNAVSPNQLN